MSLIKRLERSGKRLFISAVCTTVRTPKIPVEEIRATAPRSVLVVRQHHQMGDMLLATPAFRAIKTSCDNPEVGVVCRKINRAVLLNHPHVDEVFEYNNRNPLSWLRLLLNIRRRRYDMVIVLHTMSFSFTSAVLGLLSGAKVRVGSTSEPFGSRLSEAFYHCELPLPAPAELERMNESEHNLYPLRAIGIDTPNLEPLLVPDGQSEQWADDFLEEHPGAGETVVVHPGAGKAENIWSPESFAEALNQLGKRRKIRLFAVEGPGDAETVAAFRTKSRIPSAVVRSRRIGDIAALFKRADLVLCNDTGIMHVAAAAGATVLAVFGPTDPVRWAPLSPTLHVVRAADGNLQRLTAATVCEKAVAVLDGARGERVS